MLKIKDLKVKNIIKDKGAYFCKILDKTDNLVAVSNSWRETYTKEEIEERSKTYNNHYTEYDLKDYTLVTPKWKASELKVGDKYWYHHNSSSVHATAWDNYYTDIYYLKTNNIFQTQEKALEAYNNLMN